MVKCKKCGRHRDSDFIKVTPCLTCGDTSDMDQVFRDKLEKTKEESLKRKKDRLELISTSDCEGGSQGEILRLYKQGKTFEEIQATVLSVKDSTIKATISEYERLILKKTAQKGKGICEQIRDLINKGKTDEEILKELSAQSPSMNTVRTQRYNLKRKEKKHG